jgi:hypothetical protein
MRRLDAPVLFDSLAAKSTAITAVLLVVGVSNRTLSDRLGVDFVTLVGLHVGLKY